MNDKTIIELVSQNTVLRMVFWRICRYVDDQLFTNDKLICFRQGMSLHKPALSHCYIILYSNYPHFVV